MIDGIWVWTIVGFSVGIMLGLNEGKAVGSRDGALVLATVG